MPRTKLITLGTSTPSLVSSRNQSPTALIVNILPYLIDCGSGIQVIDVLSKVQADGFTSDVVYANDMDMFE